MRRGSQIDLEENDVAEILAELYGEDCAFMSQVCSDVSLGGVWLLGKRCNVRNLYFLLLFVFGGARTRCPSLDFSISKPRRDKAR